MRISDCSSDVCSSDLAYGPAIQAASGMMSITGHPDTGPVKTGFWTTDMATGVTAAFAIAGALFERQTTGRGRNLDISMLDTALSFMSRSEEHTSELQSLMRISYAVFCLNKKTTHIHITQSDYNN